VRVTDERDIGMSHLVVAVYDDRYRANEVLLALRSRQLDDLIDLEDAACVTKEPDLQLRLHHTTLLTGVAAYGGELWAGLLGLLLFPDSGARRAIDYGVDGAFTAKLRSLLEPGSSALFILLRRALPETVIEELGRYGGSLLDTALAPDAESQLASALRETAERTRYH
jgi:uncharacterized membrane protein